MAPTKPITLRLPSKYAPTKPPSPIPSASPSTTSFQPPALTWLHRTWTVTHSTLAMWRTAQNVRITYTPLPPSAHGAAARIDDLVTYEKASGKGGVKTVAGIDTASASADTGAWDWRGKGLLGFVTSHWEVLGWGEWEEEEGGGSQSWVVTWFEGTLFTKEGVDLYSDRKGGMSKALAEEVLKGLRGLKGATELVSMVEKDMQEVKVVLPWKEG